jgi:capsular exopolysaccharide synthesis family protein
VPVFHFKRRRKNLLDGLALDAPYVTEMRRLLQNLYRQQKSAQIESRSYMVTSAAKGEGKSTTCALMAIISARIFHKRTLLLDGDLHRPTIHSLLGISKGPGLADILRAGTPIHAATHSTSLQLLRVIPSGYPRRAVNESYADDEFGRLLQELRPNYDVIFVDAPPSVPTIEPVLMAEHVDALLIVAMAGRTPLAMARRSMQILAPVEGKIAGIILNNAADGLPYYFNYSYYGYQKAKSSRTGRTHTPR